MIFRCSFMAASGLLDDSRPSLRDCCCSLLCSALLCLALDGKTKGRQERPQRTHLMMKFKIN
jgi:hypothetical protein